MANSMRIVIQFFVTVACILSVFCDSSRGYRGCDCSCHDTDSGMTDICSLVARAIKTADRNEGKVLYLKNKYDEEISPFINNHECKKRQSKIRDELRDIDEIHTWREELNPMVDDLKVQERLNIYRRLYDLEIKSYRRNKALKGLQATLENYTDVENRKSLHEKISGVVSDTLQAMDNQVLPNAEEFKVKSSILEKIFSRSLSEEDPTANDVDVEKTADQPPIPDEDDVPLAPQPYTGEDAPNLCRNATIDAVTRTQDGSTYFFQGDFYWKYLSNETLSYGYPRKIADDWHGLEGNLDTAFRSSNGKTYFFKGGRYWRFTNQKMDSGYPKPLDAEFKGIPPGVSAAFLWCNRMEAYFFKGDQYWVYDINKVPHVSDRYPKPIWKRLPLNVDAIFQWENGRIYFFKGGYYSRLDYSTLEVDTDRNYPSPTPSGWFRC